MVAIYAVLVLNVMGGLLSASREYLESFCRITIPPIAPFVRLDDVLADKPNKKNKKSKKNKVA